jgi:hypothetical protein
VVLVVRIQVVMVDNHNLVEAAVASMDPMEAVDLVGFVVEAGRTIVRTGSAALVVVPAEVLAVVGNRLVRSLEVAD